VYITRDHGYMVYDAVLSTDANFNIQPQSACVLVMFRSLSWGRRFRRGSVCVEDSYEAI